mmetsp:Transcript_23535/g.55778  ORF Transcript_23535/g.55778 Transcript_23535/m.55778 type:complete len:222 (+) Transcript_23535:1713-2378(+)
MVQPRCLRGIRKPAARRTFRGLRCPRRWRPKAPRKHQRRRARNHRGHPVSRRMSRGMRFFQLVLRLRIENLPMQARLRRTQLRRRHLRRRRLRCTRIVRRPLSRRRSARDRQRHKVHLRGNLDGRQVRQEPLRGARPRLFRKRQVRGPERHRGDLRVPRRVLRLVLRTAIPLRGVLPIWEFPVLWMRARHRWHGRPGMLPHRRLLLSPRGRRLPLRWFLYL